ncbi:MAG: thiamine diphosphokinase [Clostridia bacterium]|nr:thiamine diphosphokinase [Clostridia bacterium]
MMNCVIILNGDKTYTSEAEKIIENSQLVICADGGAKWASDQKISIDVIIGDMDSIDENLLSGYIQTQTKIIRVPKEKDETDGVLAVDYAIKAGAKCVNILGAEGGRMDHQLGNIMLLKRLQEAGCEGKLILKGGYAFMADKAIEFSCRAGDIVSIVPFGGELVIKSSEGLKYKITDDTPFSYSYPVGVSNIAAKENIKIEIEEGNALIFCYNI